MKKLVVLAVMASLVFSMAFAQGESDSAAESVQMNIQHNLPKTETWQTGFEFIKSEMQKRYPDQINSTIYPNGQLANNNWATIFEQTQENVVQMTCESQVTLASLVPELFALSTPFMFEDMEHVLRFMDEKPAFVDDWFAKLEDKNLKVITYWPRAPRQLLNSQRPIIKPADIKGMAFRVPAMDLFVTTFQAMEANPVPLPSGEIYTAMQMGTVAGEDNAISTVQSTRTYEQGKYFNVWNYMGDGVLVVVNKDWFEGLTADMQKSLLEVGAASTDVVLEATIAREVAGRKTMEEAGIEFTEFTAEMKEPWRALMGPAYKAIEKTIGTDAWNELVRIADATR
ncbi:MAG: TRAP transporter substrate-binding protein [Sphaerochaetaceae bacterium]|nr:TRAP transporter substrate-binding protein [Sphaerochaetaceae bacterium]